jgi:hypothetical protein
VFLAERVRIIPWNSGLLSQHVPDPPIPSVPFPSLSNDSLGPYGLECRGTSQPFTVADMDHMCSGLGGICRDIHLDAHRYASLHFRYLLPSHHRIRTYRVHSCGWSMRDRSQDNGDHSFAHLRRIPQCFPDEPFRLPSAEKQPLSLPSWATCSSCADLLVRPMCILQNMNTNYSQKGRHCSTRYFCDQHIDLNVTTWETAW